MCCCKGGAGASSGGAGGAGGAGGVGGAGGALPDTRGGTSHTWAAPAVVKLTVTDTPQLLPPVRAQLAPLPWWAWALAAFAGLSLLTGRR